MLSKWLTRTGLRWADLRPPSAVRTRLVRRLRVVEAAVVLLPLLVAGPLWRPLAEPGRREGGGGTSSAVGLWLPSRVPWSCGYEALVAGVAVPEVVAEARARRLRRRVLRGPVLLLEAGPEAASEASERLREVEEERPTGWLARAARPPLPDRFPVRRVPPLLLLPLAAVLPPVPLLLVRPAGPTTVLWTA